MGSSTGPAGETCGTWRWLNSECTADAGVDPTDAGDDLTDAGDDLTDAGDDPADAGPPDYCTSFDNCSECDFEHTNTCGWCADDGRCMRGEGGGPYEGTCSSWTFFPVGC